MRQVVLAVISVVRFIFDVLALAASDSLLYSHLSLSTRPS